MTQPHAKFQYIDHIDAVLPHVQDPAFIISHKPRCIVVDYVVVTAGLFGDAALAELTEQQCMRRECRGLKFHVDGRIMSRGYHKFFNVNELAETQLHAIDWSQPHVVLDKLDGSMIHTAMIQDQLVLMTMMGTTDIAEAAQAFLHTQPGYEQFLIQQEQAGYTVIMEWCSRQCPVVIRHAQDALIITAMRNTMTGDYMPWHELQALCHAHAMPLVTAHDTVQDVHEFMKSTRALMHAEGHVVRFHDGGMVKVKADEYIRLHAVRGGACSEKLVLDMTLNAHADDVKSALHEHELAVWVAYESAVHAGLADTATAWIADIATYRKLCNNSKKYFVEHYLADCTHWQGKCILTCWDRSPHMVTCLLRIIDLHLGSGPRIDMVRSLWGGAKWLGLHEHHEQPNQEMQP